MKKNLIIILLIFSCLFGEEHKHIIIAPPKSGAHLVENLLSLLINKDTIFNITCTKVDQTTFHKTNSIVEKKYVKGSHIFYSEENNNYLKQNNFKTIFIIRDPRDVALSFALLMKSSNTWQKIKYYHMPLEKMISQIVLDFKIEAPGWTNDTINNMKLASDFYGQYMGWLDQDHVCVIKYEDLIGNAAGGTKDRQQAAIKKVADYLEVNISNEQIKDVANQLVKKEEVHNKIGAWKTKFSKQNKQDYKNILGDIIIKMGYETDLNW